ncbi:MAG: 4-hydroxythreonine-4-phosphate dehydrogenase PdxA [Halieaceae bacterium]|jgi:4-hydroxythreonine-4-phosphate dehydrogenase|nr:4-hydroxythreonine-4-phosphate dehydrogenase PdxA [Halieaceae bacterium]
MTARPIAITSGEPAGIGPDLLVQLAQAPRELALVALADPAVLSQRAQRLDLPLALKDYGPQTDDVARDAGTLSILPVNIAEAVVPGQLNRANAAHVLAMLGRACQGCLDGEFAAMVTAPVQKSIIIESGVPFQGHTEFLAAQCQREDVVMLLACAEMRVALVTTHLPLSAVPAAITPARLRRTLEILHADLKARFGFEQPRIAVLGLNPHAGESGHLGDEEQRVIAPVLQALREQGMTLLGPLPADTAFGRKALQQCDAVLAMYHDQGLPTLKYAGFGHAVNVTLGLPIIRTSVDHGTALDLAGRGGADASSLREAVALAAQLAGTGSA